MKHHIHVSQKNIDNGVQMDPYRCPIANAFQSVGLAVFVSRAFMYTEYWSLSPDKQIQEFIDKFDAGLEVHPFTFTFDDDCE